MTTTIIISVLTYALLRSVETFIKLMWSWYRDYKQTELEDTRRIDR